MWTPSRVGSLLALPLLAALGGAGCGGGVPTAPSPPGPALPPIVLSAGPYTLTLAAGAGSEGEISFFVCLSIGQGAPQSALLTVLVEPADTGWVGRSTGDTLTLTLGPAGDGVTGTIRGSAPSLDGGVRVTVESRDAGDAFLTGRAFYDGRLGGQVDGQVVFDATGGSYGCSHNSWSLARQY